MPVKIDMEMPKSCRECRFCFTLEAIDSGKEFCWCDAGDHKVNGAVRKSEQEAIDAWNKRS